LSTEKVSASNLLPLELVQSIVAYFQTDRKALFSLSTVSSTWRTATLPHLFPEANISDPSDFVHWKNLIQLSPELATHCVRTVTYEPGMSILGRGLASLSVDVSSPDNGTLHGASGSQSTEPWEPFLPLPPMPSVASLKWAPDRRYAVRVTPVLQQYLLGFPSLLNLTLNAQFENLHEFRVFLGLCGRLESLVLNVSLKPLRQARVETLHLKAETETETPTPTPDLSALEKLAFDHTEVTDTVISILLSGPKTLNLREIIIRGKAISNRAFGRLLQVAAPTVEELAIEPSRHLQSVFFSFLPTRILTIYMLQAYLVQIPPSQTSTPSSSEQSNSNLDLVG